MTNTFVWSWLGGWRYECGVVIVRKRVVLAAAPLRICHRGELVAESEWEYRSWLVGESWLHQMYQEPCCRALQDMFLHSCNFIIEQCNKPTLMLVCWKIKLSYLSHTISCLSSKPNINTMVQLLHYLIYRVDHKSAYLRKRNSAFIRNNLFT